MLTVDFERFPVVPGMRVLDLGCGAGRHAFELFRRGAHVVAMDRDADALAGVRDVFAAMTVAGEIPAAARAETVVADALDMPFDDASFDGVIAAEVLEHVPADEQAMREIARVLKPGCVAAVTVPRWLPERICWALSDDYHSAEGGHVRIYRQRELVGKLATVGLLADGAHFAHGLHSPYWWLKCLTGVNGDARITRAYHRLLVWDITHRPWVTRAFDKALNPLIGKSLVVYTHRAEQARAAA